MGQEHIFVSHSTKNDAFVKKLRETLELFGELPWIDSRELTGGEEIETIIEEKIRSAHYFLVVISFDALGSKWVQNEVRLALDEAQKRKDDYKIISVILPGIDKGHVDLLLPHTHLHIFVEDKPTGFDDAMPKIFAALGRQLPDDWKESTTVNVAPIEELILELTDPIIEEKDDIHPTTVFNKMDKQIGKESDEVFADLRKVLTKIEKQFFKVSIGYPKLVAKGYASPFVIQFYFEELTNNVKMKIKEIVGNNYTEQIYDTELKLGQIIKIKLHSADIKFSEPIVKKLDSSINTMIFLGKPMETCQPRKHKVVLSISNNKTDVEYQSEIFSIKVVDFAFDHISYPLLSRFSAIILGIGSFTIFILTLLEQIDKTIGLTSGAAAGVVAAAVYANLYNLYQRIRPSTP